MAYPPEPLKITARKALESAHCVQDFDVLVVGATAPDGSRAVMLGVVPPGQRGWSFPLPISEARRVAAQLIEAADRG